ncbi:hypothetical protein RFI_06882 [Reticulomyxa filosa]|uniref:Uncharacterized protein n=1 Tax=Reticulomyxa filosa TaxID=46433 RepID=X6NWI1_RETFI|nr:hypothetical protein RFI_06882 [Reticulomyxa filosa]|eukprot:ETO30238.1 hypothetical protein RFI_06882 [Reticulomyxa filosa]
MSIFIYVYALICTHCHLIHYACITNPLSHLFFKELEHAKYKQLQVKYAAERSHWIGKTKEFEDQISQMEQTLKNMQRKLREKVEQNILLQDQLQNMQQQFSELPSHTQFEAQERVKWKQQEQFKVQQSQQTLFNQIEMQIQQMAQMQAVIEQQQFTIESLQRELIESKEKTKLLEKKLEEAQSSLIKQVPSSNKELLQQQIKVLKTQRKVLVKEVCCCLLCFLVFLKINAHEFDCANRSKIFAHKMIY